MISMKNAWRLLIGIGIVATLALIKIYVIGSHSAGPMGGKGGPPGGKDAVSPAKIFVADYDTLSNDLYLSGTLLPNEMVELKPEINGRVIRIHFTEGSFVQQGDVLFTLNDSEWQANLKKLKVQEKNAQEMLDRRKAMMTSGGVSREELQSSENQLAAIQADIQLVESQLEKTSIKAPFSGKVGTRNISQGAFVSTGTVLTTLVQTNPVKLDFYVPEKYAQLIKTGSTLSCKTSNAQDNFKATIQYVEPKVEELNRSIKVRALASNTQQQLIPGSFVNVRLPISSGNKALMIPTEAIVPVLKGQKVWICKNGMAQDQRVVTGLRTDTKVQLLEGLQAGDSVLISGILGMKAGTRIKALK